MSKKEVKNDLELIREFCATALLLCDLMLNESIPPRVRQYRKKLYAHKLNEVIEVLNAQSEKTST